MSKEKIAKGLDQPSSEVQPPEIAEPDLAPQLGAAALGVNEYVIPEGNISGLN